MNITSFPFDNSRLRIALGPANPRLINSARNLASGGADSHHLDFLFSSKTLISIRSTRPQSLASTQTLRRVTTSSFDSEVSVSNFSRPFPGPQARPVILLRTLSRMAASKPPSGFSTTDTVCQRHSGIRDLNQAGLFTLRHGLTRACCPLLQRLHLRSLAARRGRES